MASESKQPARGTTPFWYLILHAGVFHRIDDHFGIGIPETKTINPFSKTDWAETGVEPDVKVKSTDALETAKKLAENKLQRK
jgi:hypothetical protein